MKNTKTEIKNTLHGINTGVNEAEDQMSDFEDKKSKNIKSEQKNRKT